MKYHRAIASFSRIELIVVIAVCLIFAFGFLFSYNQGNFTNRPLAIECAGKLHQIGLAYRVWAEDRGDQFPFSLSSSNGGWNEILSRGNAGLSCWMNYRILSNELIDPRTLVCPTDIRNPATNFEGLTNNLFLSYFVGVNVSESQPRWVLGGDRNLSQGTPPRKDYGFSTADGKGSDVVLKGPVCWSLNMHAPFYGPSGNILFADGSVQRAWGRSVWDSVVKPEVDALAKATNSSDMRLIFP